MQIIKSLLLPLLLLMFFIGHTQIINQIAPISRNISGNVSPGYIFITQSSLNPTDTYPSALCIMDADGKPVFFKACSDQTYAPYVRKLIGDFKLQSSGKLSYAFQTITGGIGLYLLDSNFTLIDSIQCVNDVANDGHDFLHLPDGSYHLLGNEFRVMDLNEIVTDEGITGSENATVAGNVVQRFDAQKNLQFEWRSLDHFEISDVYSYYFTNPDYLDFSHCNSIEIDDDGNYLLSFRHLNEVTKIDSSSGAIIWRLGGKQNQFTFLGDTMKFTAQHDARRITNGNLTLFDNGEFNSMPIARAIEYELDEVNKTAAAVWQFHEPNGYSSDFIGNTNRLPNGNTLIDWGGAFPLEETISFTEVDAAGNIVMELDFDSENYTSYRAVKQELPFTLIRPEIVCDGENLTLTAPDGYTSYQWNTGAETQSITVVDTGTYQVWVNQGIGYISSEEFYISDLNSICNTTNFEHTANLKLRIYPNPASNQLFIDLPPVKDHTIQIFNSYGQLVKEIEINLNQTNTTYGIELSEIPSGFYVLKIGGISKNFIKKD